MKGLKEKNKITRIDKLSDDLLNVVGLLFVPSHEIGRLCHLELPLSVLLEMLGDAVEDLFDIWDVKCKRSDLKLIGNLFFAF